MQHPQADTGLSRTIASTATMRLTELHTLNAFYTPLEERFERITRLAKRALNMPVAAITLFGENKQWFKSVAGWNIVEIPVQQSLCNLAIVDSQLVVISDAGRDKRLATHPFVQGNPHFRFYAGKALTDSDGIVVGSFCLMDIKPRTLSGEDMQFVLDFAAMAERELLADVLANIQNSLTSKLGAARREAMIDPLTRVWNRRGATVLLRGALKKADDEGKELALGVLDLDQFKRINDLHGHQVGDQTLKKVARILVASVREDDIVCRIGGDEFSLIMSNTSSETAQEILDRVLSAVWAQPLRTHDGTIRIALSGGCAVRGPAEPISETELFARADSALMRSKNDGRNCVRMAS